MTIRAMVYVVCGVAVGAATVGFWPTAHANGTITSESDMKLPSGEFPFLSDYSVPFKQTESNWVVDASPDQLEKNKQVVLRFYHGDMNVLADDFVEHDPGEPSTRVGWTTFIHNKHPGNQKPPAQIGSMATDASSHGLISMVAEGDIVVVVRKRNFNWPGGPTPVYESVFVDIWRVKDGRLAEQWVTTRPDDAVPALIQRAKDLGYWGK